MPRASGLAARNADTYVGRALRGPGVEVVPVNVLDGMVVRLGFRGGRDGLVAVALALVVVAEVDPPIEPGQEVSTDPPGTP